MRIQSVRVEVSPEYIGEGALLLKTEVVTDVHRVGKSTMLRDGPQFKSILRHCLEFAVAEIEEEFGKLVE